MKTTINNYYQNIFVYLKNKIYSDIFSQAENLYNKTDLFSCLIFGYICSIILFFSLNYEPSYNFVWQITALLFITGFIVNLIYRKFMIIYIILSLSFTIGLAYNIYHTQKIYLPKLHKKLNYVKIEAKIEEVKYLPTSKQLILSNLVPQNNIKYLPKKIRINVRTKSPWVKKGDLIKTIVSLQPIPKPILPNSYNFQRDLYYQSIGAVGFAVAEIIKTGQSQDESIVDFLRQKIYEKILSSAENKDRAEIISALTLGQSQAISKKLLEHIRNSGLAHLLCVSGMHLTSIVFLFFGFSRFLLTLFPRICLSVESKKIASIIAILGSLFYLLLTGSQIAASRAFIMSSLILLANLLDRETSALRSICLAAFILLILNPYSLMKASFQMSFSAALALITWYNKYGYYFAKYDKPHFKMLKYLLGVIVTSLVASFATMPFSLYHFNQAPLLGIIANLIAVPITSLVILPLIIINLFFMLFDIEFITIYLLEKSITIITETAKIVSDYTPDFAFGFSKMPDSSFILYILILLVTAFMLNKAKTYLSYLIFSIATIMYITKSKPFIIIDSELQAIAFRTEHDEAYLHKFTRVGNFKKQFWQQEFSGKLTNIKPKNYKCEKQADHKLCHFNVRNQEAKLYLYENYNYLIEANNKKLAGNLKESGSLVIYSLNEEDIVKTNSAHENRIWFN